MKKITYIILILILIISFTGCKEKVAKKKIVLPDSFTCVDGRIVSDEKFCNLDDEPEHSFPADTKPEYKEIDVTSVTVSSRDDAKDAFESYVKSADLDYEFVSAELKDDKYLVIYKHENGKRSVYVTKDGKILEQKLII